MDLRQYLVDGSKARYTITVDLDSREPLNEAEATALNARIHDLIGARRALAEDIRKVTRRLMLSGEESGS